MDNESSVPFIRPDLLRGLIDHTEHGVTIAEREGSDTILLYVNKAFERLTGYTVEECLYRDCRFLQNNDHDQPDLKRIRAAIKHAQPVRAVLRNYRKDGTLFWNDLTINPYFDPQDRILYYIGIQKDVTDLINLRHQLEEAQARIADLEKNLADLRRSVK